jgi:hypothetical protein
LVAALPRHVFALKRNQRLKFVLAFIRAGAFDTVSA